MSPSPSQRLAAFAAGCDIRELPADIVEKAKACLLYAAAVGVASMRTSQPGLAAAAVEGEAGASSTRFYDGKTCGAGAAAFANGTLFHARVQDDAHPAGHVGVVVVPAALAVSQSKQVSGAHLLSALVAGYETALRIGRDHTTDLSARGFRTTPVYGVFGAAAAASRLLGLDAERTSHALALAANMAGGLREFAEAGSDDFPFQAGTAAMNGILAARLADAGATGAATALEGAAGFFRAFGEPGRSYGARLSEGLGQDFEIRAVTYKPYPICQFHRGIVRGCVALRERAPAEQLVSLSIRMHPFEADFFGVKFKGPFASFPQTFMSAAFCAALAWSQGEVTLDGLTTYGGEDVLRLVTRIEVVADPSRQRYAPLLEARLRDGSTLSWEEREREGAYVLTWQNACRMADVLCAEMGVRPHAERLIEAVSGLQQAAGVQSLVDVIGSTCAAARKARSDSTLSS